jgi:hypothetical protein
MCSGTPLKVPKGAKMLLRIDMLHGMHNEILLKEQEAPMFNLDTDLEHPVHFTFCS